MFQHTLTTLTLIFITGIAVHGEPQAGQPIALPAKENFYLFALAGQSNMAGRGRITPSDNLPHPRVLALSKDGSWVPAVDPIHYDKKTAGAGLARAFAIVIAEENEDIVVGLIPTACGGSSISKWKPGSYHSGTKSNPYDDALARINRAREDGVLKAILWHQGESDNRSLRNAERHEVELKELIVRFRTDLNAPDLPLIVGQLGQFLETPWNVATDTITAAQLNAAAEIERVSFVSSDGLVSRGDNLHFSTGSLNTLGQRYAAAYLEMTEQPEAQTAEPSQAH